MLENHSIAWSEAHGGFWIVSRYRDCTQVATDWQTITSENDIDGTGNGGKGILLPQNPFQFALSESAPTQVPRYPQDRDALRLLPECAENGPPLPAATRMKRSTW